MKRKIICLILFIILIWQSINIIPAKKATGHIHESNEMLICEYVTIESEHITKSTNYSDSVNYLIEVIDLEESLSDAKIDTFAKVKLVDGKDIALKDARIFLSDDMVNWIEVEIIGEDIWTVGSDVYLSETNLGIIKANTYSVRLFINEKKNHPVAAYTVSIDNSPNNSLTDKRQRYSDIYQASDTTTSSIQIFDSVATAYGKQTGMDYCNIGFVANYYDLVWDSFGYWEYRFSINGLESATIDFLCYLRFYATNEGGASIYFPKIQSANLDETNKKDQTLLNIAKTTIEYTISALNPYVSIAVTAYEIANALRVSPDASLEFQNRNTIDDLPDYYDFWGQMCVAVNPNTDFQFLLNMQGEFRYDLSYPSLKLYLSSNKEEAGLRLKGEGALRLIGTSPGEPTANIKISPTSYNYGDVKIGEYKDKSFKVENTGSSTANINARFMTGGGVDFSIIDGGGTHTIPAGGQHMVTVRFKPSAKRSNYACLEIAGNNCNTVDADLYGTGIKSKNVDYQRIFYNHPLFIYLKNKLYYENNPILCSIILQLK